MRCSQKEKHQFSSSSFLASALCRDDDVPCSKVSENGNLVLPCLVRQLATKFLLTLVRKNYVCLIKRPRVVVMIGTADDFTSRIQQPLNELESSNLVLAVTTLDIRAEIHQSCLAPSGFEAQKTMGFLHLGRQMFSYFQLYEPRLPCSHRKQGEREGFKSRKR